MATALPRFDNTLGALFVGFGVSAVLYGVFVVQVYIYYRRYPSDKAGYKAIVALLLLLETAHQAFIGHTVYYYTITNFLNVAALLGKPIWSLVFQLLEGAVVGAVVKFFFTLRVWRFSYGNVWLSTFLLLLVFGQLGVAIVFTVKSHELTTLADIINLRVLGIVSLGIGVVNDIGIAISLCYYLQTMRAYYTQSDSTIRSLTLYAVNTGVLTSAMSFTTLIIYNFMPRNFIFVGCYFVVSKLYAVSFIAALNTRQNVRGRGTDAEPKRSPGFQIVTGQRLSLNIPLQTATIKRDDLDIESHRAQENVPRSGDDFLERERPYYTVGW